jgi:hypothetical protein
MVNKYRSLTLADHQEVKFQIHFQQREIAQVSSSQSVACMIHLCHAKSLQVNSKVK